MAVTGAELYRHLTDEYRRAFRDADLEAVADRAHGRWHWVMHPAWRYTCWKLLTLSGVPCMEPASAYGHPERLLGIPVTAGTRYDIPRLVLMPPQELTLVVRDLSPIELGEDPGGW
jgi:hypothetical protein